MSSEEALAAEQQLKKWSRRKKEALMRGDWPALSEYAKHSKKTKKIPLVAKN